MSDTFQSEILNPSNHDHNWRSIARFLIFVVCCLFLISCFLWLYSKVVIPVLASMFIAYLVSPWVDYLEHRKINRGLASAVIIAFVLAVMALLAVQLGPGIYGQLVDLIQKVPSLVDSLLKSIISSLREWIKDSGLRDAGTIDRALRGFNFMEQAIARTQLAVDGIWATGANIMGSLFSMVLIPFVTFYLVFEKPRMLQFVRKLTPRDIRPYFQKLFSAIDSTLKAVVRGHFKVAATLAVLYSIGFTAIGMSPGIAIGVAAGACRVIPYLDAVVGSILGITYVFTSGMPPTKVFAVLGIVGLVQIFDGAFITPKLIGGKVGLHPAVVILTVIAGSYHFGFWGVLLAIPVAAVVKTVYKMILPVYRDSSWFRNHLS